MSQQNSGSDLGAQLIKINEQEKLNREAEIRLAAERESIDRDLAAAEEEALAKFGTSDLVKMRELFKQYSAEDQQVVGAFAEVVSRRATLLDDISRRLTALRSGQPVKA